MRARDVARILYLMNSANEVTKTARNYGGEVVGSTVHAFERAGLGTAPYKFVGYEVKKFQACHGAPVQPGASCDYCATGIMGVYWLKSADGNRFKVGCDCVRKTGDKGLIRFVDAKEREMATAKTHARQDARIAAAKAAVAALSEKLASMPHPTPWQAERGRTALDYVSFMFERAGRKGMCEAAKYIEALSSVPA